MQQSSATPINQDVHVGRGLRNCILSPVWSNPVCVHVYIVLSSMPGPTNVSSMYQVLVDTMFTSSTADLEDCVPVTVCDL